MFGKFVQHIGSRSDGVGSEEQFQAGFFSGGDKTVGGCLVTRDIHVSSGDGAFAFNLISMGYRGMSVVSVVISGMDNLDICFSDGGLLGKFLTDKVFGDFQVAVEQPANQTYREHIAAFHHGLVVHFCVGKAIFYHL